ncbi:hypothetical protein [Streptosporangium sp. NPDC087985]|uniref:hypothetical protein n=1 Tax=Streptosporangium sp. NPDC087985 TaxID=3366196 RepID=UPI0037FBD823
MAHWIMRHPDHLHADEERQLKDIMVCCPQLDAVRHHGKQSEGSVTLRDTR